MKLHTLTGALEKAEEAAAEHAKVAQKQQHDWGERLNSLTSDLAAAQISLEGTAQDNIALQQQLDQEVHACSESEERLEDVTDRLEAIRLRQRELEAQLLQADEKAQCSAEQISYLEGLLDGGDQMSVFQQLNLKRDHLDVKLAEMRLQVDTSKQQAEQCQQALEQTQAIYEQQTAAIKQASIWMAPGT